MYTEEPRRTINWAGIIKKGVIIFFVALIFFLIIWLITKNSSNGVNVDYENGQKPNNTTLNNKTYSEIYINNYRYFHDTAKEYFLISNLPNNGETLKFTLQQLIDKSLIIPFSYTNKENCDTEASYVSVKNVDGKYTMTTTLVCGTEVATTKEELGCNQICVDKVCKCVCEDKKETVTEYQYKQAYNTTEKTYTCPSGYTKSGTKCVKNTASTIAATKKEDYKCPAGYTMNGTGAKATCTKETGTTIKATAKTTYTCPSGYTKLNDKYCTNESEDVIDATVKYSCSMGTLSGKYCLVNNYATTTATKDYTYYCPNSNQTLSGSYCVTSGSTTANPTVKYTCSTGELVNTKYCRTYSTKATYKSSEKYLGKTYNGCTFSGSYTAACDTYSGCTMTKYKYYCSTSSYTDKEATATYTCPSGYTKSGTGANTKCTKTNDNKVAASYIVNYTCPKGYTKVGSGSSTYCVDYSAQEQLKATATYTCPKGYEQSATGKYCVAYNQYKISTTAKTTYTCPTGYTKSGSNENTICTSTSKDTTTVIKNISYTCPNNYKLVGTSCSTGNTETINATVSSKKVTKYKYKWSTETSLSGWEKTGETRQSTVSSK